MVFNIHYNHKKVYAWTANKDRNMKKIIGTGADGLVSDNPRLAQFYRWILDKNYLVENITDLLYEKNQM